MNGQGKCFMCNRDVIFVGTTTLVLNELEEPDQDTPVVATNKTMTLNVYCCGNCKNIELLKQ